MLSKAKKPLIAILYLLIHFVILSVCYIYTNIGFLEGELSIGTAMCVFVITVILLIVGYNVDKRLVEVGCLDKSCLTITAIWNVLLLSLSLTIFGMCVFLLIWSETGIERVFLSPMMYIVTRILFVGFFLGKIRLFNKLQYDVNVTTWMKVQVVLSLLPVVNIFNFFVNLIIYRKDRVMCKKLLIAACLTGLVTILASAGMYLVGEVLDIVPLLLLGIGMIPYGIPLLIDLQLLKTQYMYLYKPKTGDSLREP